MVHQEYKFHFIVLFHSKPSLNQYIILSIKRKQQKVQIVI